MAEIDTPKTRSVSFDTLCSGGVLAVLRRQREGSRLRVPFGQGSGHAVTIQLLVLLSGIDLDDLACFEIKVLEEWLIRYESIQKGKGYREFLVPAIGLNNFPRRRLPDKEWRSMPWAR
jgi:hypothetical protein